MTKSRGILSPRRFWTDAELELLREMYPHCHSEDVAAWLDRRVKQVYQAAKAHGLSKTAEYLASPCAGRMSAERAEHPNMVARRFQPGLTPWNKGRDSRETGTGHHSNSRRTQFRKGRAASEARNYQPIGTLRINADGHLERKVTDDPSIAPVRRWTPVYRLVWEAEHGPIPEGHLVRFRDGMKTNVLEQIAVDKLECISRAENAQRNHPAQRDPELFRLIQLKGAITRQVNRIAKEAQEA